MGKNHGGKAGGNGSFDLSRKAISYYAIKNFPFFVSDYLKFTSHPTIFCAKISTTFYPQKTASIARLSPGAKL